MVVKKDLITIVVLFLVGSGNALLAMQIRERLPRGCKAPSVEQPVVRRLKRLPQRGTTDQPVLLEDAALNAKVELALQPLPMNNPLLPLPTSSGVEVLPSSVAVDLPLPAEVEKTLPPRPVDNQVPAPLIVVEPLLRPQLPAPTQEDEQLVGQILQELAEQRFRERLEQQKKEIFALHGCVTLFMKEQLVLPPAERKGLPRELREKIRFTIICAVDRVDADKKLTDLYTPLVVAALFDMIGLLFQDCFTKEEYEAFADWLERFLPIAKILSYIDCEDLHVKAMVLVIATHAVRAKRKHLKSIATQWNKYLANSGDGQSAGNDRVIKNGLAFLYLYFQNNKKGCSHDQACRLIDHLKNMCHWNNAPIELISRILQLLSEQWNIALSEPAPRSRAPRSLSDVV